MSRIDVGADGALSISFQERDWKGEEFVFVPSPSGSLNLGDFMKKSGSDSLIGKDMKSAPVSQDGVIGNLRPVAGSTMSVRPGTGRVRRPHRGCGVEFGSAKQEFAQDADIGHLIRKYRMTGILPKGEAELHYADEVREPVRFEEAYERVERARERFASLPSEVRLDLRNDPGTFARLDEKGLADLYARHGLDVSTGRKRKEPAAAPPVDGGSGGVTPQQTPPKAEVKESGKGQ